MRHIVGNMSKTLTMHVNHLCETSYKLFVDGMNSVPKDEINNLKIGSMGKDGICINFVKDDNNDVFYDIDRWHFEPNYAGEDVYVSDPTIKHVKLFPFTFDIYQWTLLLSLIDKYDRRDKTSVDEKTCDNR